MLQPAGIVIVLQQVGLVVKTEGDRGLYTVLFLVLAVTSLAGGFKQRRRRETLACIRFFDIAQNAVRIMELAFLSAFLIPQNKMNACVYDCLPLQGLGKIRHGDRDI